MPKISKVGKFRKAAAANKTSPAAPLGKDAYLVVPKKDEVEVSLSMEETREHGKQSDPQSPVAVAVSDKNGSLSRGQRKRQAKREQYLRKEKMIMSSLQLQKEDEQKKRIDGLDALKEALMETATKGSEGEQATAANRKAAPTITTNKAKQEILSSELNHMSLVLQHPSFQANPFEALQEHLRNSLAKQGKEQQEASLARIQRETKAKAQRKQDKKERLRQATFKGKKKGRSKFKATRSRGGK